MPVAAPHAVDAPADLADLAVLDRVQARVLWLATSIVHHANRVRQTASGVKVGGHQASSASMVSMMTALYFAHLRGEDRVSVKPHAAPVLQAISYLLGRLPAEKLTTLREFGGLQSYPSRVKDPYPVDFSTGSVGIGATATIWRAMSRRYLRDRFGTGGAGRTVALVGDAELDEGVVWEALCDPNVPGLGELLWVVDVNRQSLDRVVPGIAVPRMEAMFAAAGWHVTTVKYGRRLQELFGRDGGDALRERIDSMPNDEYQRALRTPASEVRERVAGTGRARKAILGVLDDLDDDAVAASIRDLGGHDLALLLDAFAEADRVQDRPSVVLAYTLKAWGLPTCGHPGNHSALLTEEQWRGLAATLDADPEDMWAPFPPGSPEHELCERVAGVLDRSVAGGSPPVELPVALEREHAGRTSTQQTFGRILLDVQHAAPESAARIVTVSPDVSSSTNLGGWINRVGVWSTTEGPDWFADDAESLVHWQQSGRGQHVELGIAEANLVGLLAELGSTWSRDGEPLLPIGTIYDPFVTRALEQWSFGIYAGGQSILVGTPSGVTLAPEGGAHQSVITPSIGVEQPRCLAWEPAFCQDFEWALLAALGSLGRRDGTSSYFRLSTRPIDQSLARLPAPGPEREERRRLALAGGYLLERAAGPPAVTLIGMGAVLPEVLAAAAELTGAGVACDVACITSADLLFRAFQASRGVGDGDPWILDELFPPERAAPIVSVLDGHPHTLSFVAAVHGVLATSLGVQDFGQSGDVGDLYRHFGIDSDTIVGAAWDLVDLDRDRRRP